ncbi:Iron import ATP-binding/permease protein IrtA [Dermatophilus congolensis]|uniref:Iron import ATP-binding/permease protein IrtA n=1 Tax=Dermatophilus congolensis TaxID=1863 RepID=A0AA46BMR1_9MICO|nr:ABC transporter ATP-binding protein [Dermatophilus congolensis]STD08183.1 Iron import ATP-binding/permease protein IrtA [Dermatophilus congolensis]
MDTDSPDNQAGQAALEALLTPVRSLLLTARILGGLSGLLSIAPYVALVELGRLLLSNAPDANNVRNVTYILIATFLGQLFVHFLALTVCHFADLKLAGHIRRELITHLAQAPLSWFTSTNSSRVRKAVQDDTKTLHQLIAHAPVETTFAIVSPICLVAYAFVVNWRLGLLSIATLPLYVLLQLFSMRGMGEKTAQMNHLLEQASATVVEFCDGIEVVRAFGRTNEAHSRFTQASTRFVDFFLDWIKPLLRISALSEAVVSTSVLLFVNTAIGALLVQAGHVGVVDLLTTTLISLVIPGAVVVLGGSMWSYQLAGSAAVRIRDLIDTPTLTTHNPTDQKHTPADASVQFENVTFSYNEGTTALRNVSVTIPAGSTTALVGPSGSGKSTLATMIARFNDPTSGVIRIGGVDIRDIDNLYEHVAFVLQTPHLPDLPLREIIRLAKPEATEEQVRQAAIGAHIWDEIAALPNGLDSRANLSGGQRQRLAIAQALLADRPIVILDEATTATDPEVEAEVQAALSHLAIGRTVIVIAHTATSVIGVDQVVALRDGQIAAVQSNPTHAELSTLLGAVHV